MEVAIPLWRISTIPTSWLMPSVITPNTVSSTLYDWSLRKLSRVPHVNLGCPCSMTFYHTLPSVFENIVILQEQDM